MCNFYKRINILFENLFAISLTSGILFFIGGIIYLAIYGVPSNAISLTYGFDYISYCLIAIFLGYPVFEEEDDDNK